MSCSYADISVAGFDKEALEYHLSPTTRKRFRDDIFVLWLQVRQSLVLFLDYIKTPDPNIVMPTGSTLMQLENGL